MSNAIVVKEFDWTAELEKTVVKSLTTTFGLDFLLAEDKRGGDVDTIHNVRNGVWATEKEKQAYENREAYDSHAYHSDSRYVKKGKEDKALQKEGKLVDAYTGKKLENKAGERQLDHTISAKEISDDEGRVLAGLKGEDLANQDSNLNSTHWFINNTKRQHSVEKLVNEIAPKKSQELAQKIQAQEQKIAQMPANTPEEKHKLRQAQNELAQNKEKKKEIDHIIEHSEEIIKADKKARSEYNKAINTAYYTSSKFLKATGKAMHKKGLEMGTRQALGLVLAEVWFELREQIPAIYRKHNEGFEFKIFLSDIAQTLSNILDRVKERFKDLFTTFKDSYLGGALASLSTTLLNTFLTTQKLIGKLIREMWDSLVGVIKLIAFNPNNLSMGDLMREASKLLAFGVSTILGAMLNNYLNGILVFPYGKEIAAFVSALTVGIINLGFVYFLEHSQLAKKVWAFLNQFQIKTRIGMELERMREINAELDRYLLELSKIEFNLNPAELEHFANSLAATNDELERSFILKAEVERRNIDLPFESGNLESVRSWLGSLQKS